MSEQAHSQSEDPVAEWLYLSDRAQQIYGGLIGLSDFGHWDSYFARTFDIYTRLWRFQQQHRKVLEAKEVYGLQRWEIGDIASRIAQLYYHYYLRTSDVSYLQEAFLFYDAVRTRNYYKSTGEKDKSGLLVKQLRFYARFIVTCLLLNRRPMVNTLVEEMSHLINEYSTAVRGAGETQEWHLVLQEITLFLQADICELCKNSDAQAPPRRTIFPNRHLSQPKLDSSSSSSVSNSAISMSGALPLKLQSCILVGSHQHQVKFSELTLDMYRMMYCLEREPSHSNHFPALNYGAVNPNNVGTGPGGSNVQEPTSSSDSPHAASLTLGASTNSVSSKGSSTEIGITAIPATSQPNTPSKNSRAKNALGNPKKYLLYRPTVSQVLLYLSSVQRELQDNSVLLLYLSADGEAAKTTPSTSTTPSNSVPPVSPASVSTTPGSVFSVPPSPMTSSMMLNTSHSMQSSSSSLPGFSQLMSNISSSSSYAFAADPYTTGGVKLKKEEFASKSAVAKASPFVNTSAFYPADIAPFTRRPTFIIVDSDYSHAFLNLGTPFGAPLLVLASPQETPTDVIEGSQAGGLFTFYLHDPLSAFLFTSNKTISNHALYEQAQAKVKAIIASIDELVGSSSDLPVMITQFTYDEFMRMFIVRFCFCYYALKYRMPKETSADYLPGSYPQMPPSILADPSIVAMFKELAALLGLTNIYC